VDLPVHAALYAKREKRAKSSRRRESLRFRMTEFVDFY